MAYLITSQCIACDRCQSVCPTGAIQQVDRRYQIQADQCNNCKTYFSVPQCWSVCPTNGGCIPDAETVSHSKFTLLAHTEYWNSWFSTYNSMVSRLRTSQQSTYWERWFETYSAQVSKNLPTAHR